MEANKLKKKKVEINKTKLKKTIKTVICRPDPLFWPTVTNNEVTLLKTSLEKHRIYIPESKKMHWNILKSIPKNERPKPKPISRVKGLIFGVSECYCAVKNSACTAVLIDADVNPQAIVQQVIEVCTTNNVSLLCLKDLRQISKNCFGIQTICLGVKKEYLSELSNTIQEIYNNYKPKPKNVITPFVETSVKEIKKDDFPMDVDKNTSYSPYVYRTDKKSRAFSPAGVEEKSHINNKFTGQQFIQIAEEKVENDRKAYMRMILKKISNNPNRVKVKKK